ncbi:MAG: hypothetical protein ACREOO_20760 [bacterium]
MKNLTSEQKFACLFTLQLLLLPLFSQAQLISIKSVPVATAEQFLLVPSQNFGMGGISIALEDPSLDPFVNPAKGARVAGAYTFSAPVVSNVAQDNGGARTLPLGVLLSGGSWFGGANLAVQQFGKPEQAGFSEWRLIDVAGNNHTLLADQNSNNLYATGLIGTKLPGSGIAIAASASWAGLEAMQGVDFLYANSSRIDQQGHIADYRFGLLCEGQDGPSFELLLLHHRVHMTHEVYYNNWFGGGNFANMVENLDQTHTWGLHAGSMMPLGSNGTRGGLIFTVNKKSHPKIPNYELMNIPRDPGDTWAFNFGSGISHKTERNIVGIDLIYEPIWSHTWADAEGAVRTSQELLIPAGGKTVENYFTFNNWLVRLGVQEQDKVFGFQLGIQARFIRYHLKQDNFVLGTRRTQKESWGEWTPSIGFNLNLSSCQIRYTGSLTTGTGQPGVASGFRWISGESASSDYVIAPSGSLTLQEAVVLTHQISVAVALSSMKH